jgi:low affinity Fe/Cu permease
MAERESGGVQETFARLAGKASTAAGSIWAFSSALLVVIVWAVTGPIFHFSETWQLVINTGTTIVTFLMVFLIQHAQNKDMRAIQLKLNELIAAVEGASNRLIDVEDLTDREVEHLYRRYRRLAEEAAQLGSRGAKTSIEDEHGEDESGARKRPVKPKSAKTAPPQGSELAEPPPEPPPESPGTTSSKKI